MADTSQNIFQNVIQHVFLSPKLPQKAPKDELQCAIDLELVRSVQNSIENYRNHVPNAPEQWCRMHKMLSQVAQVLENPLGTERLQRSLSRMEYRDVLALHIRAQNCAVIVRKRSALTTFEVFEVQAPNADVMSIPGKLARSFPGRAVEVPNAVAEDAGFLAEIANFLVQMDNDILKGSTATTKKAGSQVVEVREPAHPHYISQLFVGILRGMGTEVEPRRVDKRVADEILWDKTYKPWHRSPIWLIVRVALQTSLPSNAEYKHFMIYFEAQLLRRAIGFQSFSSDLLFAMRVKMARRLYKVRDSAPEFVVGAARAVADDTEELLQGRWTDVQLAQTKSPNWNPAVYDFEDSISQSLPNSRAYLEAVFRGRSDNKTPSRFYPSQRPGLSDVRDFAVYDQGALSSTFAADLHIALFDFEESVHKHLSTWTANNLGSPLACGVIASCLKQYTSLALSHYTMDIADKSIMVLTILELWVALDRLATSQSPLLLDYSPEIGEGLVEPLLLRTTLHINQAGMVQRYLRQRHATARRAGNGSVFVDKATRDCLAVQHFRQSTSQQALKERIEREAQRRKEAKLEELKRQNAEHHRLVDRASQLEHTNTTDYRGYSRHARNCEKCALDKQASSMKIEVFEWPLPSSQMEAEAAVFELTCPEAIRIWRDETYKILCDVGSAVRARGASPHCTLASYDGLSTWASTLRNSSGAITIASSTKSFKRSHYATTKIPSYESTVCVNNGLSFKLFNTETQTWAAGPFTGTTFAKYGTLDFPAQSPYRHLRYAIEGTSHTSNQVIADQFDCPKDLSLHEHIAFGTLRSGPRLQWMNIARGLEENSLTFSRNEVNLLHTQAAWQIGPLLEDGRARDWHAELENKDYGRLLVSQSLDLLERVKANWLEATSVRTLIMLVARLLASTNDRTVQQDAYVFLRAARNVTLRWLRELLAKLQDAEIDSQILDYQERACEMAAICRSTYDVDPSHLESLLSTTDDFSILITCSINLYDNQPPQLSKSPRSLQTLLSRDRRLTHKTLPVILSHLSRNPRLLDPAVTQLWPDYRADSIGWASLADPNTRWVSTVTGSTTRQSVHLNLLEGRFLIDGKPLGRLPREYVSHPSYTRLFGQKVLDVVPASSPGMEFATRVHVNDYQISFALDTGSKALIIQAQKDGRTYELVPHTILADDLPLFFSSDYHHWADLQSGVIELRPLSKPWLIDYRNWQLRFSTTADSVVELVTEGGSSFLTDIHSPLFRSTSQRLAPLETSRYLHVTYSPERQINVDLPRMKLSFFVNDHHDLESHNMRRQVVDENQSSGAMLGLQNQLLLRAKDSTARNLPQSRTVLIPHGTVQFSTQGNHVSVSIDVGTSREVAFHQYKVDTDLRYLASGTGLTSRLFKIHLHALTSHCLPDPLTGRTGTEEALYELSEPATSSFEQITMEQAELLKQIGALTPGREYYPVHLRSMQTVHWANLPPLSQHYAFGTVTETILRRADALRLFHPLDFDPMSYAAELEQTLLERAAHRSQMYYPPETTARLPTILAGKAQNDIPYDGRDCNLTERAQAEHSASWASSLACSRWNHPVYSPCNLVALAESWGTLEGASSDLSLTYSSSWLELHLPSSWLSIYNLCRRAYRSGNQYRLAVCLASARYSNGLPENLLLALLAFATNPAFRDITPPNHLSYQIADKYQPGRRRLEQLLSNWVRGLNDTPAENMSSRTNESERAFDQRQRNYYENQVSSLKSQLVTSLVQQWPDTQPLASSVYSPWFNITPCLAAVRQYFASCSRNAELRTHLQRLETALTSQSTTEGLQLPTLPPMPVRSYQQRRTATEPLSSIGLGSLLSLRICPEFEVSTSKSTLSVPKQMGDPADTSRLESLLAEFRESDIHPLHGRYGRDLETSRADLAAAKVVILPGRLPAPKSLNGNRQSYREYMFDVFADICEYLGPSTSVEQVVSVAGVWPCRTPRAILRRLSLWGRHSLTEDWKQALLTYAQAFVEYQRTQHLARLAQENKREEFFKELDIESTGPNAAAHDPDWLLVQIDGNFRARDVQSKVASEMISPSSGANTVLQLNMGEGKSSVIVPIIAAALADGSRLVRVIVLKPLWRQMFELLVSRLAGLAGRRVYYLPFGRHIRVGSAEAQRFQGMYEECMREGGILLVQPEHLLSFKLMGIDRLISSKTQEDIAVSHTLRSMQDWLTRNSRDILDESDEILHVRYQLVYTVGQQQPLEDHPDRWTTTQQMLSLVERHISMLKHRFVDDFKYETGLGGRFPFIRIMPDAKEAVERLVLAVANDALDGCVPNLNFVRLSPSVRAMALRFLAQKEFPERDYRSLKQGCDSSMWKGLLLLRGLLASGILAFALREKHYRVNYGLDPSRLLSAVPYHAKDIPSLRAEFGHPDVAVVLTCLSYYYHGLTDTQLDTCFEMLYKLDNPALEYEQWVRRNDATPQELRHLNGVNVKDREQFKKDIAPAFSHNAAVVNFFLAAVVFPKEAKEFPHKLATSGWDLAQVKDHVTTGFSGTNDNQYLLPTSIAQADPVKQSSTNALVLNYLLQPENNHYACNRGPEGGTCSAKDFVTLLVKQDPEIRVLLDVGAQMLELKNEDLVRCWLDLRPDISAAVFFSDKDELVVLPQTGVPVPLVSSPFSQQLDKCIVYLDDGHTRGTDLKLPKHTRAAVTLGPKVTKDRLLQGCMRMRKLGHGQSVMFFAPSEIDSQIRKAANLDAQDKVDTLDILRWAMLETCNDLQHHISHWAQQGVEHKRRAEAEQQYISSKNITGLKEGWTTPESRSLEDMYGISNLASASSGSFTALARGIPSLRRRLDLLGVRKLEDSGMDEEQEREVSHEVERERQIERPPKSEPASHSIHQDLRVLVFTGSMPQRASCFSSLFLPLQTLNLQNVFAWSGNLLATTDYGKTLASSFSDQLSDFMRPLNWILSAPGGIIVAVSSYEVNELLPQIRTSKAVRLHVYAPRVIQSMQSFSDLQFYSVSAQPTSSWSPPSPLIQMQINLWAGQLYLEDHEEYRLLCAFLGIYLEAGGQGAADVSVQSDGFVVPEDRRVLVAQYPEYSDCEFSSSPVNDLKELVGRRRKGMEYMRTHLGQVLHARKLTPNDF
ncbi:hypothetical protein BDV93DRAFT_495249 [Ceratobasidium sp. AG-I]|nr:hypothetical protein BDV93DRAFT_495249 [Ceratobasidium sp. AG-I]